MKKKYMFISSCVLELLLSIIFYTETVTIGTCYSFGFPATWLDYHDVAADSYEFIYSWGSYTYPGDTWWLPLTNFALNPLALAINIALIYLVICLISKTYLKFFRRKPDACGSQLPDSSDLNSK